jgi:hypothetical protein
MKSFAAWFSGLLPMADVGWTIAAFIRQVDNLPDFANQ